MKVEVLQENIKNGIAAVERLVGRNASLPVLENIYIQARDNFLQLVTTDLESSIQVWMLAKVVAPGNISVPAKIISQFISVLPNDKIVLSQEDKTLSVLSGTAKNKIQGMAAEEFPIIPEFPEGITFSLDSQKTAQAISQIVDVIQPSQIRSEISGVYWSFEKNVVTLAATDSFRLAEKKIFLEKSGQDVSFILPQKPAKEMAALLAQREGRFTLHVSPNQILAEFPLKDVDHAEFKLSSRLIEGEYPNYEEIIPKKFAAEVVVKRDEFLAQLRAAALFAGKINEVKITVDPEVKTMEITSRDSDIGENYSAMAVAGQGNRMEVSFNHRFLADGFNHMRGSEVSMRFSREDGPCLLQSVGDDSYLYVVMPIKA